MNTYFKAYESKEPDFTAKIWVGQAFAGTFAFKGRSTEQTLLPIPMKDLMSVTQPNGGKKRKIEDEEEPGSEKKQTGKKGKKAKGKKRSVASPTASSSALTSSSSSGSTADLLLTKEGPGRLYYRIGLKYSPKDMWLPASDHGFVVKRTYTWVGNPGEVTTVGTIQKIVKVKAGAKVKVTVSFLSNTTRHHVAVVDYLPAGLEAENPNLKKKGRNQETVWWRWYDHQQFRETRVEMFASNLWPGEHELTYTATATYPGCFVCPPATAEEMYNPEVYGHSNSLRLDVV
jgi:hypothetical protein